MSFKWSSASLRFKVLSLRLIFTQSNYFLGMNWINPMSLCTELFKACHVMLLPLLGLCFTVLCYSVNYDALFPQFSVFILNFLYFCSPCIMFLRFSCFGFEASFQFLFVLFVTSSVIFIERPFSLVSILFLNSFVFRSRLLAYLSVI